MRQMLYASERTRHARAHASARHHAHMYRLVRVHGPASNQHPARRAIADRALAQERTNAMRPTEGLPSTWLWTHTKEVEGATLYFARDTRWEPTVPDLVDTSREAVIRYAFDYDRKDD